MSKVVQVREIPPCDFGTKRIDTIKCYGDGLGEYDFATVFGPWGSGCLTHYLKYRRFTELGSGKGQKWVLETLDKRLQRFMQSSDGEERVIAQHISDLRNGAPKDERDDVAIAALRNLQETIVALLAVTADGVEGETAE